jgi:hypothetical protein
MWEVPGVAIILTMNGARVLVACELKSYREAIAAAFRVLRPDFEVFEAEEENLDQEVGRLGPDLVVCSRLTARVEDSVPNWVELYPRCGSRSFVSLRGERSTIEEIQLCDLLYMVDRTLGPSGLEVRKLPEQGPELGSQVI